MHVDEMTDFTRPTALRGSRLAVAGLALLAAAVLGACAGATGSAAPAREAG